MRLEVDTGSYRSAMDVFYDANHSITDAVSSASSTLQGCTSMAGSDTGGQDWAASYDGVAGDMVQAGADLGGSMAMVANLLNASLVNHEGADYGARLSGSPTYGGASDGDDDPAHGTERLYPATLSSAAGGSGGDPDGWHWIAEHLGGLLWPNADTGKMRTAGKAWQDCSVPLATAGWSIDGAKSTISGQRSPEIPAALSVFGDLEQHCSDLSGAYYDVGRACLDYADQVEAHHDEVIGILEELLAWTVVDQVAGVVLSFFTAGAAEVAAQLVEAGIMAKYAERIVTVLKRLVELARAAATLIGKGLAKVTEILAKLKKVLSATAIKAVERVGSRALTKIEAATLKDALRADKMGHVFVPKHKLGNLVTKLGSEEAVMERIVRSLGSLSEGKFEVVREIGGEMVTIRGAVVNGVPRIGTAFIP